MLNWKAEWQKNCLLLAWKVKRYTSSNSNPLEVADIQGYDSNVPDRTSWQINPLTTADIGRTVCVKPLPLAMTAIRMVALDRT